LFSEPPKFIKRLSPVTEGEFGRSLTLNCQINGFPEPKISWIRDGAPLAESAAAGPRFEVRLDDS